MLDVYEVGVDLMRGRWEKGVTAKSFTYVLLNKSVYFILRISEVWSYVCYEQLFMKVYFRVSEIGLNFILSKYAKLLEWYF